MDDLDHQLIALLREDARAPVAGLAKRLRVSRGTVQARIDQTRADYTRWLDATYAASRGHVDAILDPLSTRRVLQMALEVCMYKHHSEHLVLETL